MIRSILALLAAGIAILLSSGCMRYVVRHEHLPTKVISGDGTGDVVDHAGLRFRRLTDGVEVEQIGGLASALAPLNGADATRSLNLRAKDGFRWRTCVNGSETWTLRKLDGASAVFAVKGGAFGCVTDKWGRLHGRTYDQEIILCRDPVVESSRAAPETWWFPFFAPTGTQQTFDVRVTDTITTHDRTRVLNENAQLTVAMLPAAGSGCTVRIVRPADADAQPGDDPEHGRNLILRWIEGWSEQNPDGLTVTPDRLLVKDADVLRGPWRVGDRFTVSGFGALFLFKLYRAVGFAHWEVVNVTRSGVDLRVEFWFGETGPAVRGDGTLSFRNDAQGITRIDAEWCRSDGYERHAVKLVAERTAIGPAPMTNQGRP